MIKYGPHQATHYEWAYYFFVKAISEPHPSSRKQQEQYMWYHLFLDLDTSEE